MRTILHRFICTIALVLVLPLGMAAAQSADPFEYGWNLDGDVETAVRN